MARRNGRGSKSLADTITQFERSELRLVRSASSAQILSTREASRLEERFSQSSSQKRSTDVLAAAIHLNKLLTSALKDGPGAGRTGSRSEYDIVTEMGAVLRAEQARAPFAITVLDIDADPELQELYSLLVPVTLLPDGEEMHYRVDLHRLRAALATS